MAKQNKQKADQLRELLKLVTLLRSTAERKQNNSYRALFLRAATTLEERASQLAYRTNSTSRT
jgi:hypothetical protein